MYRRKTAFQKASIRDKKRIISAIMRKMLWMI